MSLAIDLHCDICGTGTSIPEGYERGYASYAGVAELLLAIRAHGFPRCPDCGRPLGFDVYEDAPVIPDRARSAPGVKR